MDQSQLLALKQSYQDMIEIIEKCIQERAAGGMPMGLPKSLDRYANPDSDKLISMVGPTDYSKYAMPSINISINIGESEEEPEEELSEDEKEEEDYVV